MEPMIKVSGTHVYFIVEVFRRHFKERIDVVAFCEKLELFVEADTDGMHQLHFAAQYALCEELWVIHRQRTVQSTDHFKEIHG
jgi:hypothetical protein